MTSAAGIGLARDVRLFYYKSDKLKSSLKLLVDDICMVQRPNKRNGLPFYNVIGTAARTKRRTNTKVKRFTRRSSVIA